MELTLNTSTRAVEATRYFSFAGQTVALRTVKGVHFLTGDHNGTASIAVDAKSGAVTRRYMDPFGAARGAASLDPWVDDKGFLGKPVDESTGLTHIGAREYEPENGRFISADPLIDFTDSQQINGYAYANNNPVTFSDPTGLMIYDEVTGMGFGNAQVLQRYINNNREWYTWKAQQSTVAGNMAAAAAGEADASKQRAIAAAKELAGIIADELGLTDALDCFTTGSLGACGATALNVATSFVGGMVGKLATKYGLPWKWKKAVALGKRIGGLVGDLVDGFLDWQKLDAKATRLAGIAQDIAANAEKFTGRRPGCSTSNSFTPTTRVLMADGTSKPIKDVKLGDKVKATDPKTGKTLTKTVTAEIKGKGAKHLVKVTIDTDGKKGTKTASLTATNGHPFWVPELDEWIDATDLKAGQWLRTSAGTHIQITVLERWTANDATVHNLTVADVHTYYALAGATSVLVHNCGERKYEAGGKHGSEARGSSRGENSAEPRDGQGALDNSEQIKSTSPRRVGIDPSNGDTVILDRTAEVPCGCTTLEGTNEIFHGHVRTNMGTDPGMAKAQAVLRKGIKAGRIKVP